MIRKHCRLIFRKNKSYRRHKIDGEEVKLDEAFAGLHTKVYENILAGNGITVDETLQTIEFLHTLRERKDKRFI